MEKVSFTRREWLFTILAIVLVEYIILAWSHELAGSELLLSYISFAATVSSILLAVIAIIYSFYQSESNSRSSSAIQNQVANLVSTARQLDDSATSIRTSSKKIDEAVDGIAAVSNAVAETRSSLEEKIGAQHKELKSLMAVSRKPREAAQGHLKLQDDDRKKFVFHYLATSSYTLDMLGYSLHKMVGKKYFVGWEFMRNIYAGSLPIDSESKIFSINGYMNSAFTSMSVLSRFGVIERVGEPDDDKYKVVSNFDQVLEQVAGFVTDSENDFVVKSVANIDIACKSAEESGGVFPA